MQNFNGAMGTGFAKTGGRQIRKGWRHRGVELSHATGLGYGVDEEAASMSTVRVLVAVLPQVSAKSTFLCMSHNSSSDILTVLMTTF